MRLGSRRSAVPDAVTIYPIERMGNQLFIWAAGLAQARRLGCDLVVNAGWYRHARPERTYAYSYDLGVFDNGTRLPDDDAHHRPVFLGVPAVRTAVLWHTRVLPHLPDVAPPVFMERSLAYDPAVERIRPGTTMVGHFQSWRYFDDVADEVRKRLSSLTAPSDWFREQSELLQPGRGDVMLHVRRGDYLLPEQQRVQGLTTRAYYLRALAVLRRMGFDGRVWLSSDSPDAARAELADVGDLAVLDPPPGTSPFEVVLLMARADALVTANSSFSWWAGYLGDRPGHTVIAPRPWLTDARLETRDLLPPHWLTLDRG